MNASARTLIPSRPSKRRQREQRGSITGVLKPTHPQGKAGAGLRDSQLLSHCFRANVPTRRRGSLASAQVTGEFPSPCGNTSFLHNQHHTFKLYTLNAPSQRERCRAVQNWPSCVSAYPGRLLLQPPTVKSQSYSLSYGLGLSHTSQLSVLKRVFIPPLEKDPLWRKCRVCWRETSLHRNSFHSLHLTYPLNPEPEACVYV